MSRRYYSKAHYDRLSNGGTDTPERIAERIRSREIGERANREMMERFAPLTAENAGEAMKWQADRIKELTEARS